MRTAQYLAQERAKKMDVSWYTAQERKIQAADTAARQARHEIRMRLDPGHVYVIRFASGLVKVGKSGDPDSRMKSHAKWADHYNDAVDLTWVSEWHLHQTATERLLIGFCKTHGHPVSREYFTGISFETVRNFAQVAVDCAVEKALLAERVEHDRKRREYLTSLADAVDGDLSSTWQAAHQAAFGDDPIDGTA